MIGEKEQREIAARPPHPLSERFPLPIGRASKDHMIAEADSQWLIQMSMHSIPLLDPRADARGFIQ